MRQISKSSIFALVAAIPALLICGCGKQEDTAPGGQETPSASPNGEASLNGAGATFPAPLYQQWFQEYKTKTGVAINYQPIGSGGGIKDITAKAVDFGASDAPMNEFEMRAAPGILHVPTVAGAVCVSYNVPGVPPHIHLTGTVIAAIYLGTVKTWNDPAISALNPGVALPATPIVACHRSDTSSSAECWKHWIHRTGIRGPEQNQLCRYSER